MLYILYIYLFCMIIKLRLLNMIPKYHCLPTINILYSAENSLFFIRVWPCFVNSTLFVIEHMTDYKVDNKRATSIWLHDNKNIFICFVFKCEYSQL